MVNIRTILPIKKKKKKKKLEQFIVSLVFYLSAVPNGTNLFAWFLTTTK